MLFLSSSNIHLVLCLLILLNFQHSIFSFFFIENFNMSRIQYSNFNVMHPFWCLQLINEIRHTELVKCYIWSMALYGAETWTLRAVDKKHLESFEMW
jgi:hypothetical protein